MKDLRGVFIILIVIVMIVVLVAAFGGAAGRLGGRGGTASLPVDLKSILPGKWDVKSEHFKSCDFDSDGEQEHLVIYGYDGIVPPAAVANPLPTPATLANRQLIGGAIYDSQVNRVSQEPGAVAPLRPAFMVPYRLLPEIYGLKGQGYLGQSGVSVILLPGGSGADCKAKELVIYGYSNDTLPTTLSLFRWGSEKIGYASAHFQANVRLWAVGPANSADAMPGARTAKPVMDVFTFDQLNQRSLLCSVRHFARTAAPGADGLPPNLDFQERPNDQTIDFCYGTPQDPAYPEGVVVALLRGQNPDKNETPTKDSYFMPGAKLPAELAILGKASRTPVRILSIDVPGSLGQNPPQGVAWEPTDIPQSMPKVWWRSSNSAPVEADIVLDDQKVRRVRFTLIIIANQKSNADTHWRITQVDGL